MNFKLTKGNVFDNRVIEDLIKYNRKESKLFGDKSYICKEEIKRLTNITTTRIKNVYM